MGLEFVTVTGTVAPGGFGDITASCTPGNSRRPMSASYSVNAGSFYQSYRVLASVPSATGWRFIVGSTGSPAPGPATISLTIACATLPPL